jgi:hypothetical protein
VRAPQRREFGHGLAFVGARRRRGIRSAGAGTNGLNRALTSGWLCLSRNKCRLQLEKVPMLALIAMAWVAYFASALVLLARAPIMDEDSYCSE